MISKRLAGCALIILLILSGCTNSTNNEDDFRNDSVQEDESDQREKHSQSSSADHRNFIKTYSDIFRVEIQDYPTVMSDDFLKYHIQPNDTKLEYALDVLYPENTDEYEIISPDSGVEQLCTKQGLIITKYGSELSAMTEEWLTYSDFIGFRNEDPVKSDDSRDVELSFMSRNSVLEMVRRIIEELYPEVTIDEILLEAFSGEHLQKLVMNMTSSQIYGSFIKQEAVNRNWSSEDEIYCASVTFKENNVDILDRSMDLRDGSYIRASEIEFWINKRGVQSFSASGIWSKDDEKTVEIHSCEEAIESVAEKYGNIVTDELLTITDAELIYAPIPEGMNGECYLVPIWRFEGFSVVAMNYQDTNGILRNQETRLEQEIYVNGITGRIIE